MMQKLISFFQLLGSKLAISIKRFPEPILLAILTTITLIYMNHTGYTDSVARENLIRISMTFAIGIPLFLCIKIFFERKANLVREVKVSTYLGAILLLILCYLFMLKNLNNISISRYIAFNISLYLIFSFIPYFLKKKNYELYVITLFNRFVTTYLYSLVLFLGLAAIIATINLLFNVNISSKVYYDMFLIVVGIFAPAFFLSDIPRLEVQIDVKEFSKVLKVLLLYIILPLILVYTAILYVYFIKIAISMQWPEGILGHLVLWYSIISTIVIFFIYPLQNKNKWVKIFITFFPKLILPLLVMMFISLGIRIKAYGITENRYFVLLVGFWVSGCMLYHTLSKRPKNIFFTITLAIISIMAVVGPLSSYSVSKLSQNIRFESILNSNEMIAVNGEIKSNSGISEYDKEQISSIILYFENNHDISDLRYIPNDFEISQTEDIFGFEIQDEYFTPNLNKYFNYFADENQALIDIKDYDYFADYTSYRQRNINHREKSVSISYSEPDREIEIVRDGKTIYTKNINKIALDIYGNIQEDNVNNNQVNIDKMTYIDNAPGIEILYIFNDISGVEEYNGEIKIHPPMFYIFAKINSN